MEFLFDFILSAVVVALCVLVAILEHRIADIKYRTKRNTENIATLDKALSDEIETQAHFLRKKMEDTYLHITNETLPKAIQEIADNAKAIKAELELIKGFHNNSTIDLRYSINELDKITNSVARELYSSIATLRDELNAYRTANDASYAIIKDKTLLVESELLGLLRTLSQFEQPEDEDI